MRTLSAVLPVDRRPNSLLAWALGVLYLAAGTVCLAVTLGSGMAQGGQTHGTDFDTGRTLGYLGLGLALMLAAARGLAKRVNSALGAGYLVLGVVLLFTAHEGAQLLTLNHPDNVLHLGTAALLLGIGRTQD